MQTKVGSEEGRLSSRFQSALICKLRPVTVCLTSSGGGLKTRSFNHSQVSSVGWVLGMCWGRVKEGESPGVCLSLPVCHPLDWWVRVLNSPSGLPLNPLSKGPSSVSQTREGSGLPLPIPMAWLVRYLLNS